MAAVFVVHTCTVIISPTLRRESQGGTIMQKAPSLSFTLSFSLFFSVLHKMRRRKERSIIAVENPAAMHTLSFFLFQKSERKEGLAFSLDGSSSSTFFFHLVEMPSLPLPRARRKARFFLCRRPSPRKAVGASERASEGPFAPSRGLGSLDRRTD